MGEVDIQVILNELQHIRTDIEKVDKRVEKIEDKLNSQCEGCMKVISLETRLSNYEAEREKIDKLTSERNFIKWVIPILGTLLGWIAGGGWKLFVFM